MTNTTSTHSSALPPDVLAPPPALPPIPLILCAPPPITPLPHHHFLPMLSPFLPHLYLASSPSYFVSLVHNPALLPPPPPHPPTRYRGLKKIVKLISDAEKKMEKSYNHQAVELLKQATRAFKGMAVSSRAFRSEIEIKMCTALSEMKQYVVEKTRWREWIASTGRVQGRGSRCYVAFTSCEIKLCV